MDKIDALVNEMNELKLKLKTHILNEKQIQNIRAKLIELNILLNKEIDYCRLYGISIYGSYFS